jgi:hypothetical protein
MPPDKKAKSKARTKSKKQLPDAVQRSRREIRERAAEMINADNATVAAAISKRPRDDGFAAKSAPSGPALTGPAKPEPVKSRDNLDWDATTSNKARPLSKLLRGT